MRVTTRLIVKAKTLGPTGMIAGLGVARPCYLSRRHHLQAHNKPDHEVGTGWRDIRLRLPGRRAMSLTRVSGNPPCPDPTPSRL
jgi:hypothetical protein